MIIYLISFCVRSILVASPILLEMVGHFSNQWSHLMELEGFRPSLMVEAAVSHFTASTEAGMLNDTSISESRKSQCLRTLRRLRPTSTSQNSTAISGASSSVSPVSQPAPRTPQRTVQPLPTGQQYSNQEAVGPRRGLLCLPDEMQVNVLQRLTHHELFRLAVTCRYYYNLCLPLIYARFVLDARKNWTKGVKRLCCLLRNARLLRHLRHLEVACKAHNTARDAFLKSVMEVVKSILHLQPPLKSLKWTDDVTWSVPAVLLGSLSSSLERLEILVQSRAPWPGERLLLLGQLHQQRLSAHVPCLPETLKHLSVELPNYTSTKLSILLMQALYQLRNGPNCLSYLGLKGVLLHGWTFGRLCSLRVLSLLGCEGLDTALSSWMEHGCRDVNLRRLELLIVETSTELDKFLSHESTSRLHTLKLLVRRSTVIPLHFVSRRHVHTLMVEVRTDIKNLKSVVMYSLANLLVLVNDCIHLRILSIPVEPDSKLRFTPVSLGFWCGVTFC